MQGRSSGTIILGKFGVEVFNLVKLKVQRRDELCEDNFEHLIFGLNVQVSEERSNPIKFSQTQKGRPWARAKSSLLLH